MLTFDKLKIVADINTIKVSDESRFEIIEKNGSISSLRYHQEQPFLLVIKIDYECSEVVIEFCGKVLGRDYPKLISIETIRQCFEAINALGICTVDIDAMMDAEVVKCDVTKDIPVNDARTVTDYIRSHISSYQRYMCRKMKNGNVVVDKNVISRKTKKRMTIYNKEYEMQRSSNRPFVKKNGLEDEYSGMCRFELNLNSKQQIREALHISDTRLLSVLSATGNPIVEFLDEVVEQPQSRPLLTDKKSYMTMLVLKDCDFDLEKVEAKMRAFHRSKGTVISKVMEPYRAMMEQIGGQQGTTDMWNEIRRKLN